MRREIELNYSPPFFFHPFFRPLSQPVECFSNRLRPMPLRWAQVSSRNKLIDPLGVCHAIGHFDDKLFMFMLLTILP
jgi:hypothetical protein